MRKSLAKTESILFYLLILFLPTQFGKHFWPEFSSVLGIRIDYLSPTIYFTDIIIAAVFILWIRSKVNEKLQEKSKIKNQKSKLQFKIQNHRSVLAFIFVVCYLLLVVSLSGRRAGGLYSLMKFVEMAFVAYYAAKFINWKNELKIIALLLSVGVAFQSVLAIAQFATQSSVGGILYFVGERAFSSGTPGIANASLNGELVLRPYGSLPHPNVLAGYLLISMVIIMTSLWKKHSTKTNMFKISSVILGSAALFLTMSRVAISLWVLTVGYLVIKKIKQKRYIFAVLGISILALFTPIGSRFTDMNITDESIAQRSTLISASVKMIERSPLFGVGLGNFLPTLATLQRPLTVGTYLQPVHNIYLLVAAETGFVGLGIFVWFLWKTFQKVRSQKSEVGSGLLIVFSAVLILGLFDHYWLTLQQGQLLFALIIGLCWANNKAAK